MVGCFLLRTAVFIDGQNLFHLARVAWGGAKNRRTARYSWPSYDVVKIARALTQRVPGRELTEVRFYTGVPNPRRGHNERRWHGFWSNKLNALKTAGVYVYRGRVNRYGHEKGVDVSIAIDLVQATHEMRFETAILVSQDHDFGPAVGLSKYVAREQGREVVIESAFPRVPRRHWPQQIPGTVAVPIDQVTYDSCYDPTDYHA